MADEPLITLFPPSENFGLGVSNPKGGGFGRFAPRVGPYRPIGPQLRIRLLGDVAALNSIYQSGRSFETAVDKIVRQHAGQLQRRLQTETAQAYKRPGSTGRFSRGIRVQVSKRQETGRVGARSRSFSSVLRVTLPRYRETRYLTNLGNLGYFKDFPVRKYIIGAKGLPRGSFFDPLGDSLTKKERRHLAKATFDGATRTLKIPKGGYTSNLERPGGRREVSVGVGGFIYPLWVTHRGFQRDVVSDVLREEGASLVEATIKLVPNKGGGGTTSTVSVPSRNLVVTFGRGAAIGPNIK